MHPFSGRVLRGVGMPVPGATVGFTHDSELGFRQAGRGRAPRGILTDPMGRFEVDLDAGHRYLVRAWGREEESDSTYVYSDAGSSQELTLWLPGALTIEGILVDPSGSALPGGSAMTWEQEPAQPLTPGIGTPGAFLRVPTDKEGRFTISVPRPGTYAVVGFDERFASSLPSVARVNEEDAHVSLTLSLLPHASIAGRIRREGGAPLANASIQAVSVRTKGPYAGASGQIGSEILHPTIGVRTGEDGSFRIPRLHPLGGYTLSIPCGSRWDAMRAVARSVPAGSNDVEIVLPEGNEAEGSVEVVLEPAPLHEAHSSVQLWRETGLGIWKKEKEQTLSAIGNRILLEGLFPGDRYVVSVWARGHIEAIVGPRTAKPGMDEMVVHLEPPSTIEVEVTDRDGRPLPFALAYCERLTECDWLKDAARLLTPASGVVRFERLAAGPYQLAAIRGTSRSAWTQIEVAGGERRTLTLRVDP